MKGLDTRGRGLDQHARIGSRLNHRPIGDSEAPQVWCRILLSWKDVRHAEEDRSCPARPGGAAGA